MNRRFGFKVGLIAALTLLLSIPLGLIHGVITERTAYRAEASSSIAQSWTGAQEFLGPLVVVPYVIHSERRVWDKQRELYVSEPVAEARRIYLLPEQLKIDGDVTTEERSRGIYSLPVYSARLKVQGSFDNSAVIEAARQVATGESLEWQTPYFSMVVSDLRGVVTQPLLEWGEIRSEFHSGSELPQVTSGMHARLPPFDPARPARHPFAFSVELHGMERLAFAPVGRSTSVALKANWAHPSFVGRYLPAERTLEEGAFTARWQVSSFSADMGQMLKGLREGRGNELARNTFGVSLVNPVDIYLQTDRAVKYGMMFVVLTFVVFFLFEVMKGLRLHPMHYLLVGLSLTLFYLLLIALSEQMPFLFAYLVSALANVGLIGFYLGAVLGGVRRALIIAGPLALLYAMLFGILRSEDNALLMGSLLTFGVLAAVMVVTRRLDWYAIGEQLGTPRRRAAAAAELRVDESEF